MVKETRQEPKNQTVQVTKDGKTSDETQVVIEDVEVMVPKTETYDDMTYEAMWMTQKYPASMNGFYRAIDKADFGFYDLSGNRLSVKDVEGRLHDWTLVLISKTGRALDRRFANLFKSTTIVVGIPTLGSIPIPPPSSQTPDAASAPTISRQSRASKPAAVHADETRPPLSASAEPTFAFASLSGEMMIALRTQDEKIQNLRHTSSSQHDRIPEGEASIDEVGVSKWIQKTIEIRETLRFPTSQVSVTKFPNIEVTTAALPSVLSGETLAVMSADGKPVDPFWLQNLQDGALVIVAPVDPAWSIPRQEGYAFPTYSPARLVETPQPATPQPVPRRPQ